MPAAKLDGINIYFEHAGSGPNLLFLNGSGSTLTAVAPLIALLADQFEVVGADQRGLGRTDLPSGPYTMADLASDAAALVDHLGWKTFRVFGISFGGMIAQELAVTIPDRIERLALLCTSSGGAGGSSYPLHTLVEMDPTERLSHMRCTLDTRFTPEWLSDHEDDRAFVAAMEERQQVKKSDRVLEGERRQLEVRAGHDVYSRLGRVTCPTLVAAGRFDGIAPPTNGAAIADQIPKAEFRTFNGGHLFILQDPAALPEVIRFLRDDNGTP